MAPIPRGDLDMDNPSSDVGDSQDQDSPMRRQFSEPFRPQSTSTQISQSPEPLGRKVKCDWCGKLLELPNDGSLSEEELLNSHIASDHPSSLSFGYDGADDMDVEELDEEDEAMNEAAPFEDGEDSEMYQAEEAEDLDADEDAEIEEADDAEDAEDAEQAEDAEDGEDAEDAEEAELAEAEDAEAAEDAEQFPEQEAVVATAVNGEQNETVHGIPKPFGNASAKAASEAQDKLDMPEWLANPRTSFPEDYARRMATWKDRDVEERLSKYWNVHKVANFSPTYAQDIAKADATWQYAFADKPKKKDAPEPMTRPNPYKETETSKGKFLELENFDHLVEKLQKPELLTPEELYAATETMAVALKVYQDEYIALDKFYNKVHRHVRPSLLPDAKREQMMGHKKRTGHPLARVPEEKRDFEDRKEATLYGYKHTYHNQNTSTAVTWHPQDPFVQGGFVPTAAQARKLASKVTPGDRNPDGWTPIVRNGVELVPKLYEVRKEPVIKVTRKRKAVEVEVAKSDTETQHESENGDETEEDVRQVKRRTRGRGGRRATFETYQPPEPTVTSAPRGGRGGRARGRGRGRGIGRTHSSRASLDSQQPVTMATPVATRGRGRRGAATVGSTPQPAPASEDPVSMPEMSPMPAPEPPARAAPALRRDATAEEIEEARRLKIANSKNPKRTKAMLDHWDRFNREGRIRNPKRSKAQIEQDRQVDDTRKEVPRPAGRRRKSTSLAPIPTGNLAPKAPVAPMPNHGHMPGPTLPSIGMAQYPPPGPYQGHGHMPVQHQQLPPPYGGYAYMPYGLGHMSGPPPPPGPHDHHHRGV